MLIDKQIKSRKRVADHGEVFTADREINAMLDLVDDEIKSIDSTVLEPACGEGAFILKVFDRKMNVINNYHWSGWTKEYFTLRAVSSIYGVDIQKDNVSICKNKLEKEVLSNFSNTSESFQIMLREILNKNIVCGDTLTASASRKKPLVFNEWFFGADGEISRRQYKYLELLENDGECNKSKRLIKYDLMKEEKESFSEDAVLA